MSVTGKISRLPDGLVSTTTAARLIGVSWKRLDDWVNRRGYEPAWRSPQLTGQGSCRGWDLAEVATAHLFVHFRRYLSPKTGMFETLARLVGELRTLLRDGVDPYDIMLVEAGGDRYAWQHGAASPAVLVRGVRYLPAVLAFARIERETNGRLRVLPRPAATKTIPFDPRQQALVFDDEQAREPNDNAQDAENETRAVA